MSITDDINALREKHPYLSDVPDKDITTRGFLSVPDMFMQKHYDAYKKVIALPPEEQVRKKAELLGKVTKTLPPKPVTIEPAVEPVAPEPTFEAKPPEQDLKSPTLYADSVTNSQDLLQRAKVQPQRYTPEQIEAHQINIENRIDSPNMIDAEKAEDYSFTDLAMSLFGLLEPFTYPQRGLWYGIATAGQALPGPGEFGYELLKEGAGTIGTAAEYMLGDMLPDSEMEFDTEDAAIPIPIPIPDFLMEQPKITEDPEEYIEKFKPDETEDKNREALGLGETLFENLYDAIATGQMKGLAKRSHMNLIPGVDEANVPYISGVDLGNMIMPKETAMKLSEEARAKGAIKKAEELERLATDDLYRSTLFLSPEILIDPLWFFGPAKGGQVVRVGGKAVLMNEAAVKASRAISSTDNIGMTLQEAQEIIVKAGLGDEAALGQAEGVLETLRAQAAMDLEASQQLLKASQTEAAVENANAIIASKLDEIVRMSEQQSDLAKATLANPKATVVEKAAAQQTLDNIERTSILNVESLKNTAATLNTEDNAVRFLEEISKIQAANGMKKSKQVEDLNLVVTALKEGTKDADKIARINAGYSFHIPFTRRDYNVNINPMYRNGVRMNPRQGDTVVDIANRVGIDEIDLAHINGFKGPNAIAELQAKIDKGESIIFQLGKNPIGISEMAGSLIPGGLAYNYTKGMWKEPLIRVLEKTGVPRNILDPVDMARIQRLDRAGEPLSYSDRLTKFINTGITGKAVKGYTQGKDWFLKLLGSRWVQPLLANEKLQRALRYFEDRGIDAVKAQSITPNENALIHLQRVAPELWNNYTNATKMLFQKYQAYGDEIDNFISRMSRDLIDIAATRGDKVRPLDILNEIANAREAGTIDRLSSAEKMVAEELKKVVQSISSKVDVQNAEEMVQQSLVAIARFMDKEKLVKLEALNELRRLAAVLGPVQKESTKAVRDTLTSRISKLRGALKRKKIIPAQKEAVQAEIEAIQKLRAELNNRNLASGSEAFKTLKFEERARIQSLERKTKEILDQIENTKGVVGDTTKVELATPTGAFSKSGSQIVYNRELLNWEQELFAEYHRVIDGINTQRVADGLQPLSEESMMKATLAVLNEAPSAIKDPESFTQLSVKYAFRDGQVGAAPQIDTATANTVKQINKEIDELLSIADPTPEQIASLGEKRKLQDQLLMDMYLKEDGVGGFVPQVVSQRFGAPLPEELEKIRQSLDQMFDKYEELYRTRGFDFVKDPVERMRIWGVVDYVPHARTDSINPILKELASPIKTPRSLRAVEDLIWNSSSKGMLDRELSTSLDQAKKRVIGGTIMEINALPRGQQLSNWEFSANPIALAAHFKNASKAIANVDLLTTYLKTGVIRTFTSLEDAAARQYVPLFEYGSYAKEVQVLVRGNADEIRQLISATGEPNEFLSRYRQVIANAQENGTHLGATVDQTGRVMRSWVDDIKQIRSVDTVEQALSGVNLYNVNRGLEPIDVAKTFKQRVAEQTAALRQELQTKITEYKNQVTAYEDELAKLQPGTKEANKIGKRLARTRKQLERTGNKLKEDQAQYKRMIQRIEENVWDSITNDINKASAIANNERDAFLRVMETKGRLPNIDTRSLKMYMAPNQEMFRLYVPATVQESLSRLFIDVTPKTVVGSTLKYYWDWFNNFWKSRITIISTAFTARNVVGNIFSNALDVGVGGALNVETNYRSWALGSLVDYHAKYGSIDAAIDALKTGIQDDLVKGAKAVAKGAKKRAFGRKGLDAPTVLLREKADLDLLLNAFGAKTEGGRTLIDLGDGRLLTLDEHLKQAQRLGIINGSSTFRADVNEVMYQYEKIARDMCLAEATGEAKILKAKDVLFKGASLTEDTIYTTLPFMLGAPGVAIPKWLGRTISRRAENQGRMVNYIANLKRGRTPEQAAEHVNKFLFDYSDLTQWQKVWVRSLVPFFTWNQKNVALHAEMMNLNPQYYAEFYKFFYIALPELVESHDREQAEREMGGELPERRGTDLTAERIRKSPMYKAYRVTLPFDPKNRIYISGTGLPLESFAQNVGTISTIVKGAANGFKSSFGDETPRNDWIPMLSPYMAQTHVLARAALEMPFNLDIFRGQSTLRSGRANDVKFEYQQANEIGNLVHQLYLNNGFAADTPKQVQDLVLQGKGPWLAQYIMNTLDIQVIMDEKNGVQHYYVPTGKVNTLRLMRLTPYERMLREATTVNDLNGTMISTPENIMTGEKVISNSELAFWRALTSFTGLRIKQDISDELMELYFRNRIIQMQLDYQVRKDNIGR